MRRLALVVLLIITASCAYGYHRLRLRELVLRPQSRLPVSLVQNGALRIHYPGIAIVREIIRYRDEFFAYLMFEHFRTNTSLRQTELLLTYEPDVDQPYAIVSRLPDDLPSAAADAGTLYAAGLIGDVSWRFVPSVELTRLRQQTRVFVAAYNLPAKEAFDRIPKSRLAEYLQRFIRFKSHTDPRVRRRIEPAPPVLSSEEAQRLAADIMTVAEFYALPLEFFAGIAAMENNYMNVAGDIGHSIWKRRPDPGDVVLERRKGRVRVLNESSGVWQITRETLRYSHRQYLRDTRDYCRLPEHLRPPSELDVTQVDPNVLTTYAGLLFRDLLDRFEGRVDLAVGAYNGGPRNPNERYEAGVRMVAAYARRIFEKAAALNGEAAVEKQWIR
jgi:hypothetical protein